MQLDHAALRIMPLEAILLSLIILTGISFSIIFLEVVPHVPIVLSIFTLLIYGIIKKVKISELEHGMLEGAKTGIGAILLFFFIGILISTWMASGTIPTFIYLALEVVDGRFFYAIVFFVTALVGISIGSSLTTAATLGVAFISVSEALGLSMAITAGAVISGAFFGDKMSPLSDTTNLASSIVNVDLFDHIKNMMWTTISSFVISFMLFMMLSPSEATHDFEKLVLLKEALQAADLVHLYSLLPFVLLAIMAIKRVSALVTLMVGIISSLMISFFVQKEFSLSIMMNIIFAGYKSDTGIEEMDLMLSRGGIESMMFSISLVILALSMGGLLFKLGILPAILEGIKDLLHRSSFLISSTAVTAVSINFLVGEQYLSILLTGNAFKDAFQRAGLHMKNLSRVLEDAGTVINPLVPWSVCGVFLTSVLGVSTIDYLPFAFFCLLSPILTIFFGLTGFSIVKDK